MAHPDPWLPLVPSQLLAGRATTPGSALAAAMIEQALLDLRDAWAPAGARESAAAWLSGAPSRLPFEKCCALVGLEPEAARETLLKRSQYENRPDHEQHADPEPADARDPAASLAEVDSAAAALDVLPPAGVDAYAGAPHASGDADASPREVEAEERT